MRLLPLVLLVLALPAMASAAGARRLDCTNPATGAQVMACGDTLPTAKIVSSSAYRFDMHGDFKIFFADFRKAVLAGDREAVAEMTALPFKDFSNSASCVEPADKCSDKEFQATTSSRTHEEFLANYDRIFTPAVIAALKANKVRGFKKALDDDGIAAAGPISKGEYLLENDDTLAQRVFQKIDGKYRLARIPFYS